MSTADNAKVKGKGEGKYVPPHIRKKLLEQQQQQQTGQCQELKQSDDESTDLYLAPQSRNWKDNWTLADYEANERNTTHKQLIVLDLNGTLLCRGERIPNKARKVAPRPHLDEFLKFALENFAVMVWSSAQPANINEMMRKTMSPYWKDFVRVWDRRFCELDGQYYSKANSIKDLARIYNGFSLEDSPDRNVHGTYEGYKGICLDKQGHWTLDNIIIVDDSETKTALQKDNHVFVQTFDVFGSSVKNDEPADKELLKLKQYLAAYVEQEEPRPSLLSYLKEHPWLEFRNSPDTT
ncbi:hypothetical protein H4R24_000565 [Coemansia sp. RSA 988]|nr:hypothetical protein H4R24_000565 [Coemansia sp. RSA 988]